MRDIDGSEDASKVFSIDGNLELSEHISELIDGNGTCLSEIEV